jgi:AAA+ ATPase superfamily predicted ATPase
VWRYYQSFKKYARFLEHNFCFVIGADFEFHRPLIEHLSYNLDENHPFHGTRQAAMNFQFVGRQAELDLLGRAWNRQAAQLLVLAGRHQVGKTALMMEWLRQNQPRAVYWIPPATSPVEQLRSFSQTLYRFMHPEAQVPDVFTYYSWEEAFEEIALLAQDQRLALLIDEFPTLLKANPSLASELQIAWDLRLSRSNLLICLAGADRGIIWRDILSYRAPIFGRASFYIELKPFYYGESHSFFPEQSAVNRMAVYAFTGGLPAYWNRIKPYKTIPKIIADNFLDPASTFLMDTDRLLKNFRSKPGSLDRVLGALAHGVQTLEEIIRVTRLSSARKYLRLLIDAGFVERKYSLAQFIPTHKKRYQLTDPALRFYFRFLTGREVQIASGDGEQVLAEIIREFPGFIGQFTWKELCREWMIRAGAVGRLPAFPGEVGSAWNDQAEVDLAGVDMLGKVIFLGECRWDTELAGQEVLTALVSKKGPLLIPTNGNWKVIFLGFSRSGWTRQALAYQDEINRQPLSGSNWSTIGIQLLDLDQVDQGINEMTKRPTNFQGEIEF